jgi:hypothetical protein
MSSPRQSRLGTICSEKSPAAMAFMSPSVAPAATVRMASPRPPLNPSIAKEGERNPIA